VLAWCKENGIQANAWKSRNWASLFPLVEHKSKQHWPCVFRTDGKVEVSFRRMLYRPHFNQEENRRELLRRLNEIPGVNLPEDSITRLPTVPLSAFLDGARLENLLEVLKWFFEQVRAS
jgi:hypothetical protein